MQPTRWLCLAFGLGMRGVAFADTTIQPTDYEALKAAELKLDLSVPESPAFTALGLNPEDVTRPGTPRDLGVGLLSLVDKEGNFQTGVAIDTAPYLALFGKGISLGDYQGSYATQFLSRTQLSIATTKGASSDDESVRIALGVRVTPWTKGDPRMDDELIACLGQEAPPTAGAIPLDEFKKRVAEANAAEEIRIAGCFEKSEPRLENAASWDIGAAPTWIQEGDGGGDTEWGGATAWTSFGAPIGDHTQLIAHVRYRVDESVADSASPSGFAEQDSLLAGVRLKHGSEGLMFSLEAAYWNEDAENASPDGSFRTSLAMDFRLTDQLWLQTSLGGSLGGQNDRVLIGANLKWGGRSLDIGKLVKKARDAGVHAPATQ